MQSSPHDEGWRWLIGVALPSFILGVGWLVKHFMGRGAVVVQLHLQEAQTDEIRARIRREDESAAVANLKAAMDTVKSAAELIREERDKAQAQVKILELELEQVRAKRKLGEKPGNGKGT